MTVDYDAVETYICPRIFLGFGIKPNMQKGS